ncbi:unnamed protein product, partial [Mesorhabditis belari]|uniref:Uncharacterized protein n=1 Tax=Mesorhabditis belari TaxID=2138241 RepID=A0AAF3EVR9_9BILA
MSQLTPRSSAGSESRKRKITEYMSDHRSPKKERLEEDDENDDDVESESESLAATDGTILAPKYVLKFKEAFELHLKMGKQQASSLKQLKKVATEFANNSDFEDKERLVTSLMHYIRYSLRQGVLSIGLGLQALEEALNKGTSVHVFPDFPKRPPVAAVFYAKKRNITYTITAVKALNERMNGDTFGKEQAEKDTLEAEWKYLRELEAFLSSHKEADDLTQGQIEYVKTMIANKKKKLDPQPKRIAAGGKNGKSATRKDQPKPKTPLDIYMAGNPTLFAEYSPEKRLRKFEKRFNKLDDGEQAVYVNIAKSSGYA